MSLFTNYTKELINIIKDYMRQSSATSYNILNNLTCNNSHILIYNIIGYILVDVSSLFFPYSKQAGQG